MISSAGQASMRYSANVRKTHLKKKKKKKKNKSINKWTNELINKRKI